MISSACWRILELPLTLILITIIILIALLIVLSRKFGKRKKSLTAVLSGLFRYGVIVILAAFIVDLKMSDLYREVRYIKERLTSQPLSSANILPGSLLSDREIRRRINGVFGHAEVSSYYHDAVMDVFSIRVQAPLAKIFVAVVDLDHPFVRIKIGKSIYNKILTTRFVRENNCILAINGEAGLTARLNTGFGEWIGNLIVNGEPILLKDTDKRPFLSFDKNRRARYYPEKIVDIENTPEKFNTIWGRFDILVEGEVIINDRLNGRGPRTAMAINKEGNRLYLLVVDGRRPGYSMGLDRTEMGRILKACGAYNGMSVDPGGSSTMYCRMLGGIINFPSDNEERPTYTHFGISIADAEKKDPLTDQTLP